MTEFTRNQLGIIFRAIVDSCLILRAKGIGTIDIIDASRIAQRAIDNIEKIQDEE